MAPVCEPAPAVRKNRLGTLEGRNRDKERGRAREAGIPWDDYRKIHGAEVESLGSIC